MRFFVGPDDVSRRIQQHGFVLQKRPFANIGQKHAQPHVQIDAFLPGQGTCPLDQGWLVLLSDHLNLMGTNPLLGRNDERFGPRFPDMTEVYDREYQEAAIREAHEMGLELRRGVYAALSGPSYETPAEIRMLRLLGADAVGMSTVPEAIVARQMGRRVLGFSCITNMAAGVLDKPINHEEVIETGERVRETFAELLRRVIPKLQSGV